MSSLKFLCEIPKWGSTKVLFLDGKTGPKIVEVTQKEKLTIREANAGSSISP
jgi:predicted choloylglycine hydrolase